MGGGGGGAGSRGRRGAKPPEAESFLSIFIHKSGQNFHDSDTCNILETLLGIGRITHIMPLMPLSQLTYTIYKVYKDGSSTAAMSLVSYTGGMAAARLHWHKCSFSL